MKHYTAPWIAAAAAHVACVAAAAAQRLENAALARSGTGAELAVSATLRQGTSLAMNANMDIALHDATLATVRLAGTRRPARSGLLTLVSLSALLGGCAQGLTSTCEAAGDCAAGEACVDGTCAWSPAPDDGATPDDGGTDTTNPFDGGAGDDGEPGCGAVSFDVTETQETFEVPVGVTILHVKAWGGGGNGEGQCAFDDGGVGGYTEAVLDVVPGTPLIVIVGKRGRSGMTGEDRVKFGFGEWGGGGLSGVFRGPELIDATSRDRALVVAGGGGSAGAPGCNPGGTGNHPDAGGQPTMQGGVGADQVNGGGGGYEGGIGGAKGKAALGGTGYADPAALDALFLYADPGSAVPPRSDDPDYHDEAGTTEASGLVVLHFRCEPPPPL